MPIFVIEVSWVHDSASFGCAIPFDIGLVVGAFVKNLVYPVVVYIAEDTEKNEATVFRAIGHDVCISDVSYCRVSFCVAARLCPPPLPRGD